MTVKNIRNSVLTIGNGNTINCNLDIANLEEISDHLFATYSKLPPESQEAMSTKKAIQFAAKNDKLGLINFVKKHASNFTSDLFSGVTSAFLVEFIKKVVGF